MLHDPQLREQKYGFLRRRLQAAGLVACHQHERRASRAPMT
jgi:hypothetical protein